MCARSVSQRLALTAAVDWSSPKSPKLKRMRFKEEMAHDYKKESEGSPLRGEEGGLGGGAGCMLEYQRFGHAYPSWAVFNQTFQLGWKQLPGTAHLPHLAKNRIEPSKGTLSSILTTPTNWFTRSPSPNPWGFLTTLLTLCEV